MKMNFVYHDGLKFSFFYYEEEEEKYTIKCAKCPNWAVGKTFFGDVFLCRECLEKEHHVV